MDGCEYSIETIIVPLKERMAGTKIFGNKHTAAERITQTMEDCKFFRQNDYSTLQEMNHCHSFCDKKQIPYFSRFKQLLSKIICSI